ncbi:MAG: CpsD/CapB family tyrosine-protein kinase [Gammaproteobacteria bacterium]|nr:CpsD/CapB family tyrosine-protein kinase [Gammaproteobacteria bacterium]
MSSIVEKAMGRSQPERRPEGATVVPALPKSAPSRLPVAERTPVALRHLAMIENSPILARDFRFLKRPVLARVFGLSRSAPRAGNIVMLTSDLPHAGKSFVALNLAASMASEQMTRVVLIDTDTARRTLTMRLQLESSPGLLDLLADPAMQMSDVTMATDVESLYVIPAGRPRHDATELLAGQRMTQILKSIEDPNTVVLLDCPPLLLSSEGRVMADQANHALVVVEAGRSTVSDVSQVLQLLKGTAVTVSLVLNKAPASGHARYKDYYYPYSQE